MLKALFYANMNAEAYLVAEKKSMYILGYLYSADSSHCAHPGQIMSHRKEPDTFWQGWIRNPDDRNCGVVKAKPSTTRSKTVAIAYPVR